MISLGPLGIIIILIAIGVGVFWFIDHIKVPNPWNWLAKLIIGLVLIFKLLALIPGGFTI